jgi:hypothetical protein
MKAAVLVKAAVLASVFALALSAEAAAQDRCTHETLTVRATPVTIGYCVTGPAAVNGPEVRLPVSATYAAAGGSFTKSTTMRFIQGEGPSRVLQSVALDSLGITGTLHLTLTYDAGLIHIESALLTPGAITIK